MVLNVHERIYPVPAERLGRLLDDVAGPNSPLWPGGAWPPMILDRPLGVGADGGHGPVRYRCTAYEPGRRVEFAFTWPVVNGYHALEVDGDRLRHEIRAQLRGTGRLIWPVAFRWLHDALIEDLLDRAGDSLGHPPAKRSTWSPWVRLLRRFANRRQAAVSR